MRRLAAAVGVVVLAVSAVARGDDAELLRRIDEQAARVEAAVAALDSGTARAGSMPQRIASLHVRISALEKPLGVKPGEIEAKDDLVSLARDLSALEARVKNVVVRREAAAKAPPADKPKDAPTDPAAPPGATAAKKGPSDAWPEILAFTASAKVVYAETGELERVFDRPSGLWLQQLRATGFSGKLSITVKAKGLKHDVVEAEVHVLVQKKAPFVTQPTWCPYDLVWSAKAPVFGNGATKTWSNQEEWSVSTPEHWVGAAKTVTDPLDAKAWVTRVKLSDNSEVGFQVPEEKK